MILTIMSYVGTALSATCCFLAIFIYSILQYVIVKFQCVTVIIETYFGQQYKNAEFAFGIGVF